MKDVLLSIIMPSLNEEKNIVSAISNTLNGFDEFDILGEIVVINDGSTDSTQTLIEESIKKDSRVRVIIHDEPQGIGASFWDGVDHANGEIVCMLPGDDENDPSEIFRYYKLLKHVDMVIPFVFNKEVRSLFRNILSFLYRFIINTTFTVYLNYTNGTILYRKSILKELPYRSASFFFQTDILIRLIKQGYLFAEVPNRLDVRHEGTSKAVSFPSLLQVMKGYIRLLRDQRFKKKGDTSKPFLEDTLTSKRYKKKH